jgi:hypothetical protein
MEISFLTLTRQGAGMDQVQSIDSEMLLSFVLLIMITAKVCACAYLMTVVFAPKVATICTAQFVQRYLCNKRVDIIVGALPSFEECKEGSLRTVPKFVQETGCPLYPSVSTSEQGQPQDEAAQEPAQARQVQGLVQYARQTLQQYTNGATLRGMMTKQERALKNMQFSDNAPNRQLPGVSGAQKISPQMLYMQNLTRIVLLTVESLQQQGLVPPRSVLIPQMRQRFGMAEAGAVAQNMYARLLQK